MRTGTFFLVFAFCVALCGATRLNNVDVDDWTSDFVDGVFVRGSGTPEALDLPSNSQLVRFSAPLLLLRCREVFARRLFSAIC